MDHYDDPNEEVPCPYDPSHGVGKKRLPYHLVKCRKNYPNINYKTCPFNARHVIPAPKLNYHIRTCPDRSIVERRLQKVNYTQKGNTEVPSYNLKWCKPEASESWDDDDVIVQPKSHGEPVCNGAAAQPNHHFSNTAQHAGHLEQKLSSMSIESSQYQPGVLPVSLGNGIARQPYAKQHPSGSGVVGGAVSQREKVVMGRGLGRGRGRGVLTPARQPNTQPPAPVVSTGRGIGSFANSVKPSVPELPQAVPQYSNDPIRKDLPDYLRDLSDDVLRKRARKLAKMLRQIEKLEQARDNGEAIDPDQAQKIQRKPDVIEQLEYLKPLNLTSSS